MTFKAKVTNTSVFDHEISAKDILNAFGGNQGKTELIIGKGKSQPRPHWVGVLFIQNYETNCLTSERLKFAFFRCHVTFF